MVSAWGEGPIKSQKRSATLGKIMALPRRAGEMPLTGREYIRACAVGPDVVAASPLHLFTQSTHPRALQLQHMMTVPAYLFGTLVSAFVKPWKMISRFMVKPETYTGRSSSPGLSHIPLRPRYSSHQLAHTPVSSMHRLIHRNHARPPLVRQ